MPPADAGPWQEQAACAGQDTSVFFPSDDNATDRRNVTTARRICAWCPVARACLEFAFANHHAAIYGVYGGTTGGQRYAHLHFPERVEMLTRWFDNWVELKVIAPAERRVPIRILAGR